MSFAAAEADRRVANVLQVGVVTSVSSSGRVRVRIGDLDTPEIPVAVQRAGAVRWWWMPSVGEQVVVGAPSGDVARAFVIASLPASNEPSSDVATPMIDLGGGRMVIVGTLEVRGDVKVVGPIHASEDIVADTVSLQTHRHGGVTSGGSTTGQPV